MKLQSIQFKFLITVISAMLAITIFVGGLSIYEVDSIVRMQTETLIDTTCEKEATQINGMFGDMEKAVKIIESYVLTLIENGGGIEDRDRQLEIIEYTDKMFADVVKHTDKVIAYYLRFAPEISNSQAGLFYSKTEGSDSYTRFVPTDLAIYDKNDTEHVGWYWQPYEAGKPIWMKPYHNLNNGVLMISYVVPLYYNDRFIGVVGMDFDYTILTDRVHAIKIYENGFAHLETDGILMHYGGEASPSDIVRSAGQYLKVSRELTNGMTLVLSANYNDIRQVRNDIALKILFTVLILALLFTTIVIYVVRRIVSPLKKLTEASTNLSSGNYDVEIPHSNTYEIDHLSAAFKNMTMHLREHEKQQRFLAYHDPLTGLRNTTAYTQWVTEFDLELQRKHMDFGVLVFDLNYLKETNDNYGHDAGNKLLVSAALIIANTFKRSPVFRIGGDEFVAILQNSDLQNHAELMAKFDLECAETSLQAIGPDVSVSVAKGLAIYAPERDTQFVDVFNRADNAMYENKKVMKSAKK